MIILVINSGSSSLKYDLFDMSHRTLLFGGKIDKIGLSESSHAFIDGNGDRRAKTIDAPDQSVALDAMLSTLLSEGPVKSLEEIRAVAHRVGHGGKSVGPRVVTPAVISELRRMIPFIPLHLPAMIREIELCRQLMPDAVHVAVNDAWFHHSIPDEAAIYGLPYRYFSEKGYRRAGYHGFSHSYVSARAAEFLGRPLESLKIISCHLGNGASVCAIARGISVDTTMGMSSLEGLIMGTRSGDVDPGLIPVIMKEESRSPDDMIEMLYRDSGLLGLSGISRNMEEVEEAAGKGDRQAKLAFEAFCHKVKRYVGAMLMVLGGCDVLIFTGGIGENSPAVRSTILKGSHSLGFQIDEEANSRERLSPSRGVVDISASPSTVKILAISTFEEIVMAEQCYQVIQATAP